MKEKTYRIQNLVLKYMPALIQLLGFNYNWALEDIKFEERLIRRQAYLERHAVEAMETNMSFYDLLLRAVVEDEFTLSLFHYMNKLLVEILDRDISFEKDIRASFAGKFNNLDGLNYLNPFGEISFMHYQLFNKGNKILRMEYPFPNGKPKDFLVENPENKGQNLCEVLNIHCKTPSEANDEDIMADILDKTRAKILTETKGITNLPNDFPQLSFVVILWHTSIPFLQRNITFFDHPNNIIIPELSTEYNINGFYTYTKIGNELQFTNVYELKG